MHRHLTTAALVLAVAWWAGPQRAAGATPDQVDQAIEKGTDYLYKQIAKGSCEHTAAPNRSGPRDTVEGAQWGGLTSAAVLTLLAAGESPQDPRLAAAIDFCKQASISGTYALGFRAQIWQYLPLTPEIKEHIKDDCDALLHGLQVKGDATGFYGYRLKPLKSEKDNWYDHSNSQIGVLGVWSLALTYVVEVPDAYWQAVEKAWIDTQLDDGAWCYRNNDTSTPDGHRVRHAFSMTAGGVATLYITQDFLRAESGCTGNVDNTHIQAGMKWLGENFNDAYTPRTNGEFNPVRYYGIYGMERVGVASGRKYLGTLDWFKNGSDKLVGAQEADGGWGTVPDTCLAMLFLIHGRAPVMINKLEYRVDMHGDKTKEANWNQRPRDAANLVRWTSRATELEFNWQIVNLDVPVDELHDAPILYIAGDQMLDFTKEEEAKLKQFVEDGGLILFNADCASSRFSTAVEKLGTRLFPLAEFRELPAGHPIYTAEQFPRSKWTSKISLRGLSNGARELMILVPHDDPARFWETRAYGGHESGHEFAADLFEYMADKLKALKKGRNFIVRPTGPGGGKAVKVARLEYPGYWDPEPGGWRRLAAIMHNAGRAELSVEDVTLGQGKLGGYRVAHLTGTYAVTLPDAARAEIKAFVDGGGTLIIDACGGSPTFAASAQKEIETIFGVHGPIPLLKGDHPVFSSGEKLDTFEYRRTALATLGKLTAPRLRGLEINGRVAVFFSPEDLSVGLVGVPVDGIYGYAPATACSLMSNMLLYGNK